MNNDAYEGMVTCKGEWVTRKCEEVIISSFICSLVYNVCFISNPLVIYIFPFPFSSATKRERERKENEKIMIKKLNSRQPLLCHKTSRCKRLRNLH